VRNIEIAMSEDFLTAQNELPKKIQKKTRDTLKKFRKNPTAPGLNYETIKNASHENMRSIRVDGSYRAIVLKPMQGNTYQFLYVGNHEAAYEWAVRGKSLGNETIPITDFERSATSSLNQNDENQQAIKEAQEKLEESQLEFEVEKEEFEKEKRKWWERIRKRSKPERKIIKFEESATPPIPKTIEDYTGSYCILPPYSSLYWGGKLQAQTAPSLEESDFTQEISVINSEPQSAPEIVIEPLIQYFEESDFCEEEDFLAPEFEETTTEPITVTNKEKDFPPIPEQTIKPEESSDKKGAKPMNNQEDYYQEANENLKSEAYNWVLSGELTVKELEQLHARGEEDGKKENFRGKDLEIDGELSSIYYSSFIIEEVSNYRNLRNELFSGKLAMQNIKSLPALRDHLKREIHEITNSVGTMKGKDLDKYRRAKKRLGQSDIAVLDKKLFEGQVIRIESEVFEDIRDKYSQIANKLENDIRIIEMTFRELERYFSRHQLRISHYWTHARLHFDVLGMEPPGTQELLEIISETLFGEYEHTLQVRKTEVEQIKKLMTDLEADDIIERMVLTKKQAEFSA